MSLTKFSSEKVMKARAEAEKKKASAAPAIRGGYGVTLGITPRLASQAEAVKCYNGVVAEISGSTITSAKFYAGLDPLHRISNSLRETIVGIGSVTSRDTAPEKGSKELSSSYASQRVRAGVLENTIVAPGIPGKKYESILGPWDFGGYVVKVRNNYVPNTLTVGNSWICGVRPYLANKLNLSPDTDFFPKEAEEAATHVALSHCTIPAQFNRLLCQPGCDVRVKTPDRYWDPKHVDYFEFESEVLRMVFGKKSVEPAPVPLNREAYMAWFKGYQPEIKVTSRAGAPFGCVTQLLRIPFTSKQLSDWIADADDTNDAGSAENDNESEAALSEQSDEYSVASVKSKSAARKKKTKRGANQADANQYVESSDGVVFPLTKVMAALMIQDIEPGFRVGATIRKTDDILKIANDQICELMDACPGGGRSIMAVLTNAFWTASAVNMATSKLERTGKLQTKGRILFVQGVALHLLSAYLMSDYKASMSNFVESDCSSVLGVDIASPWRIAFGFRINELFSDQNKPVSLVQLGDDVAVIVNSKAAMSGSKPLRVEDQDTKQSDYTCTGDVTVFLCNVLLSKLGGDIQHRILLTYLLRNSFGGPITPDQLHNYIEKHGNDMGSWTRAMTASGQQSGFHFTYGAHVAGEMVRGFNTGCYFTWFINIVMTAYRLAVLWRETYHEPFNYDTIQQRSKSKGKDFKIMGIIGNTELVKKYWPWVEVTTSGKSEFLSHTLASMKIPGYKYVDAETGETVAEPACYIPVLALSPQRLWNAYVNPAQSPDVSSPDIDKAVYANMVRISSRYAIHIHALWGALQHADKPNSIHCFTGSTLVKDITSVPDLKEFPPGWVVEDIDLSTYVQSVSLDDILNPAHLENAIMQVISEVVGAVPDSLKYKHLAPKTQYYDLSTGSNPVVAVKAKSTTVTHGTNLATLNWAGMIELDELEKDELPNIPPTLHSAKQSVGIATDTDFSVDKASRDLARQLGLTDPSIFAVERAEKKAAVVSEKKIHSEKKEKKLKEKKEKMIKSGAKVQDDSLAPLFDAAIGAWEAQDLALFWSDYSALWAKTNAPTLKEGLKISGYIEVKNSDGDILFTDNGDPVRFAARRFRNRAKPSHFAALGNEVVTALAVLEASDSEEDELSRDSSSDDALEEGVTVDTTIVV